MATNWNRVRTLLWGALELLEEDWGKKSGPTLKEEILKHLVAADDWMSLPSLVKRVRAFSPLVALRVTTEEKILLELRAMCTDGLVEFSLQRQPEFVGLVFGRTSLVQCFCITGMGRHYWKMFYPSGETVH
ncbi:MAG: hypothetical protein NUW02_00720 [Candidatus Campbellbacteria bacterium]|nr:hypothetical protein [Candidatus Campbellbacteria bacterium]